MVVAGILRFLWKMTTFNQYFKVSKHLGWINFETFHWKIFEKLNFQHSVIILAYCNYNHKKCS
jgi:hypothetical protein